MPSVSTGPEAQAQSRIHWSMRPEGDFYRGLAWALVFSFAIWLAIADVALAFRVVRVGYTRPMRAGSTVKAPGTSSGGSHMKRISIVARLGAACVLAAAATGSARTDFGAPPCTPKMSKTAGRLTVANCGPATATLKLKGKTYTFKSGFCSQSKTANGALQLDARHARLNAKGNAGHPYFSMLLTKSAGKIWGSVFEADLNGKQILGDSLVDAKGFPAKGTFTSNLDNRRVQRLVELPRHPVPDAVTRTTRARPSPSGASREPARSRSPARGWR